MEDLKCEAPGCDCKEGPFYLHSLCHPNTPTWATMTNGGLLRIICSACEAEVAKFQIGVPSSGGGMV